MSSERDKLLVGPTPAYYDNPPPYNPAGPPPPSSQFPPPYYPNQHQRPPPPARTTVVVHEVRRPVVAIQLPPPPDYMGLAICATIFCFPLGIIAIMLSNRVRENIQCGNIAEAYRNAYSVRIVSRLAGAFGVLIFVGVTLGIILPLTLPDNSDNDDY